MHSLDQIATEKDDIRDAWPKKKVIRYIQPESGRLFDPEIVKIFLDYMNEVKS